MKMILYNKESNGVIFFNRGGPIPDNAYEYNLGVLFNLYRKAIDPETQDLIKELGDRHII